jgi:hypothetical protein
VTSDIIVKAWPLAPLMLGLLVVLLLLARKWMAR